MTRKRNNSYDNTFLDWLRNNKDLDSERGYRVYDVDGLMWNFHSKKAILVEFKTHDVRWYELRAHQKLTLEILHRALSKGDEFNFQGTYLISCKNSSPEDGPITVAAFNGERWQEMDFELSHKELTLFFLYKLK